MTDQIEEETARNASTVELHKDASEYILKQATFYWKALTTEAKVSAYLRNDNVALESHARDANRGFFHRIAPAGKRREILFTVAGLSVGVGAPQLLSEFSREGGPNTWWLVAYTVLTTIGALMFIFHFLNRPTSA